MNPRSIGWRRWIVRIASIILPLSLCLVLLDCATLIKGNSSKINIHVPAGTTVINEHGDTLAIYKRLDSSRYVTVPHRPPHQLTFAKGRQLIQVVPTSYSNVAWLFADIATPLLIGLVIDGSTQAYREYEDIAVFFAGERDNTAQPTAVRQGSLTATDSGRLDIQMEAMPERPAPPPLGVVVGLGLGVSAPGTQAVIGPSNQEVFLGFRTGTWMEIGGRYSASAYVDFTNDLPGIWFDGYTRTLGGYLRAKLPWSLLLEGGAGQTRVWSEHVYMDADTTPGWKPIPDFVQWIWTVHGGLGYGWEMLSVQCNYEWGLQRFAYQGRSARFRMFTILFGLRLVF
jgi:hypothetical protein